MRVTQNEQMVIGEVDISKIEFDPKSRDDIPKILRGLQFVYTNVPLRTAIFKLLESKISPKVSKTNGRPGMALWNILVCGVIRLDLNCDYDRLHELVNQPLALTEIDPPLLIGIDPLTLAECAVGCGDRRSYSSWMNP